MFKSLVPPPPSSDLAECFRGGGLGGGRGSDVFFGNNTQNAKLYAGGDGDGGVDALVAASLLSLALAASC